MAPDPGCAGSWLSRRGGEGDRRSVRPLGPEGGTASLVRFAHADPHLVYAATRAGLSSLFFFGSPPAGGRIFRSADGHER